MDHARGKRKLETHRAEVPEVALELAVAIIFGRGLPERRQGIFLFAALPGIGDPFTPGGVVPGPQVEEDAAAGGREDGRRSEVLSKREERVRGWRGKGKERERARDHKARCCSTVTISLSRASLSGTCSYCPRRVLPCRRGSRSAPACSFCGPWVRRGRMREAKGGRVEKQMEISSCLNVVVGN